MQCISVHMDERQLCSPHPRFHNLPHTVMFEKCCSKDVYRLKMPAISPMHPAAQWYIGKIARQSSWNRNCFCGGSDPRSLRGGLWVQGCGCRSACMRVNIAFNSRSTIWWIHKVARAIVT